MKLSWFYSLLAALNLAGFPAVAALALIFGGSSTQLSIAMRTVILGMSVGLLFLAAVRRQTYLMKGWYWLPLSIFWAAYIARLWYSTEAEPHLLSRAPLEYWMWAIGACLIPMLGLLTKPNERAWRLSYICSMALLILAGVIVAIHGTTLVEPDGSGSYDTGRLRLDSLNPIAVGHLGVSLLLLAVWPLISDGGKLGRWYRPALISAAVIGLYLATAAASRGPIVSLVVVVLFYALTQNVKRARKLVLLFGIVCAMGYAVAAHLGETNQSAALSRIAAIFGGEDLSVSLRKQALLGAVEQFSRSPILGDGLEERSTRFYPHNIVVEAFMTTGVIGGTALLFLIGYSVNCAYRLAHDRSLQAWVSLVFIQYLVAAQFSGAIYGSTIFWAFMGATISLAIGSRTYQCASHGSDSIRYSNRVKLL